MNQKSNFSYYIPAGKFSLNNKIATFTYDHVSGRLIPKPPNLARPSESARIPEVSDETEFNHLIDEAEQIKDFPDASMFFPVDESDY